MYNVRIRTSKLGYSFSLPAHPRPNQLYGVREQARRNVPAEDLPYGLSRCPCPVMETQNERIARYSASTFGMMLF